MNLTVAKKDLVRLLARMQGVVERKSTMPILANVLLEASGAALRLSGTDLYLSVTGAVDAEVSAPGKVCVSAKDLFERVKMMPDGPLVLTGTTSSADGPRHINGVQLKAKGTARRYSMRGMPGEDFPPMPRPAADSPRFAIPPADLLSLISRVHFAISTDETRAHLNSALLERDGELIRMAATDGHRLAKAERKVPGDTPVSLLISLKAIGEIRRLLEDHASATELTVIQSGSNTFFEVGGLLFSAKSVEAQFPPWKQVLPQSWTNAVRVNRSGLLDAARAVSVAADDKTGGVRLGIDAGVIRVTSQSPDSGEGSDELPCDVIKGGKALVGMNAKYLLDELGAISSEEVELRLSGELDPVICVAVGDQAVDGVGVLMPMRL